MSSINLTTTISPEAFNPTRNHSPKNDKPSFTIGGVIKKAVQLTDGNKGIIWACAVLAALIAVPAAIGVQALLGMLGIDASQLANRGHFIQSILVKVAAAILISPINSAILGGLTLLAIKRGNGRKASVDELFSYFHKAPSIFLLGNFSCIYRFIIRL